MISPKLCSTDNSQQERHSRDLRRNTKPACSPDLSKDSGIIVVVATTINTITNSETKYRNQRAKYSTTALILIHTVVVLVFILIIVVVEKPPRVVRPYYGTRVERPSPKEEHCTSEG